MKLRLSLAAIALAAAPLAMAAAQNWNVTYAETARGHKVGNPEAPVKLTTFVSYTCPHCATFEKQSDAALRAAYIHEGKVELEVRPVLRNPVDLAASLIAQCGPAEGYFQRHRALMLSHDTWMTKARGMSEAQTQRWFAGPLPQRLRAIASDLDFYELMEPRGLSVAAIDRCLADEGATNALVQNGEADNAEFAIPGTPSFAINGKLAEGVHSWASLQPLLDAPRQ